MCNNLFTGEGNVSDPLLCVTKEKIRSFLFCFCLGQM